ncbi:MAG: methionine biosynthesis protein MetW [Candidatus Adiutrix sp.]|jgi:methionine biosynthesis protein MetW|nr:methionine biosynthesis protein MetW [Candidatus Adiutrix sp.]
MTRPDRPDHTAPSLGELRAFAAYNLDVSLAAKAHEILTSKAAHEILSARAAPAQAGRRWQDQVIMDEVPRGASVLDLGCGEGELLSQLIRRLAVRAQGVELDPLAVLKTIDRGVPVLNIDLDHGLVDFADQSFDYVILESTLQTLKNPLAVLREMLRVGRRGIVAFPNFGHWRVRFDLAVRGRMPVTPELPYGWHDTPNIHLFTLADFLDWCLVNEVTVEQSFGLVEGRLKAGLSPTDNLVVEEALIFLERAPGSRPGPPAEASP